ncbi:MAG TPA: asparagine synthetase B family protein, partial [Vicinamibacterales bacterium]|nr:asparagine synthetase B family protein [Vicinamibacterales bacterium]
LRLHPLVSRDLHEPAIADFLLFGANREPDTTSFRDIRRMPPAHCMTWTSQTSTRRRYWTLPIDDPLHFRRADEYTDRFRELLRASLRDRLRTRRVTVFMSGGVDSTTLAAVAQSVLREQSTSFSLQAVTSVYDRLIPDRERHYAGLVADHLKIPIRFDVRDDELSIAEWDQVSVHTPEPVDNPPACAASVAFLTEMAADARVFLYGEGPDNALRYEWRRYIAHLLSRRRFGRLAAALSSDLLMHRRVPFWSSIRRLAASGPQAVESFPPWLNEEFAARCACRERWHGRQRSASAPPHPVRPLGHSGFGDARWQALFEDCDLSAALSHADIRHPFLDLRLLRYMLAVPAMPWCRNKLLVRRAMRTALPRQVLRRRKNSIAASADFERVKAAGFPRLAPFPDLMTFVNPAKIPAAPQTAIEMRAALRPLGLNSWLRDVNRR